MNKKWIVLAGLAGFSIAVFLGVKRNTSQRMISEYGSRLEANGAGDLQFEGLSEEELTDKDYVYSDGTYEYFLNQANGNLERMMALPDIDLNTAKYSVRSGKSEGELIRTSTEMVHRHMALSGSSSFTSELSYSDGLGYSVVLEEVEKGLPTGNAAFFEYDDDGNLAGAAFSHSNDRFSDEVNLSRNEAIAKGIEVSEEMTLSHELVGSDNVTSVVIGSAEAKITNIKGEKYWSMVLDGHIMDSQRGRVHKMYEVRIHADTGELYDIAWSLE